jgi:hypothetical protein
MFVQVIEGRVKDPDLLIRQTDRWAAEIKPSATGYLGSTGGLTPDGGSVWIVRFDTEANAQANGARPEQDAWWNETAKAYDGEPTFHNCSEVDTLFGGGSDDAGFVQVIQGRARDQAKLRDEISGMESTLREARPDILGITVAWHGDGGFTQVVYFRSESEAREREAAEGQQERDEFMAMFEGPPTFLDLPDPKFD